MPAFELNLTKNTIGLICLTITALIVEGSAWLSFQWQDALLLIMSGVIGLALADTLYMKTLNILGAGKTAIVGTLYSPFIIFLSYIYLKEEITFLQFLGLLLIAGGIILISSTRSDNTKQELSAKKIWQGIFIGISSSFLTAAAIVSIKPIIEEQPFFWSSSLRMFSGMFAMFIYLILTRRLSSTIAEFKRPHNWRAIFISGFIGAYITLTLWLAGFKYTTASVASILNETSTPFIVLLAWLILKESMDTKKAIALILAFIGVFLVVIQ